MLNLIAEIDEFKGSWKALDTLAPERLAALRKVATITVKARINELIEMKKLIRHGKGRSTWYSLG